MTLSTVTLKVTSDVLSRSKCNASTNIALFGSICLPMNLKTHDVAYRLPRPIETEGLLKIMGSHVR